MAAFFGADEIWSRHNDDQMEPVVLVGVRETSGTDGYASEEDFLHSLEELEELSRACMMAPAAVLTQQLPKVNAGMYVGSGKAEEIRTAAADTGAGRVIFNDTLSPSQIRNLQKALSLPVMDRTALILEIFERRARTREARLQVELAKLRYLKPRLIGMWETQNRQGGASGAMSSKGEGETQLEIDRRTIDHRLSELRKELKVVAGERETRRKKRQGSGLPLAALVGYTNAGKSTIMNAMLDRYVGHTGTASATLPGKRGILLTAGPESTGGQAACQSSSPASDRTDIQTDRDSNKRALTAETEAPPAAGGAGAAEKRKVFEADMLFATLDTTVRRISVAKGREFLLSDTVGFIHRLPTALVEAFHSTLEEVTQADLLLQVVDASDPHHADHIAVTKKTIEELGAGHIPMITIFNKADLADPPTLYPRQGAAEQSAGDMLNENVYICAKDPASVEFLAERILARLQAGMIQRDFLIPYDKGRVVSFLMEQAVVTGTEYTDAGTLLSVRCDRTVAEQAEKMLA